MTSGNEPDTPTPGVFARGEAVAITFTTDGHAQLVGASGVAVHAATPEVLAAVERLSAPRWVWWSKQTASAFVADGIRPARCWDLGAVHRMLAGGWRSGPAQVWAHRQGLDASALPVSSPPDLFSDPADLDPPPIRADGYLHPSWVDGRWATDPDRAQRWAELALDVYEWQLGELSALAERPAAPSTARSESAAELLCAELEHDGLPIDVAEAERIVATFIGERPHDANDEMLRLRERDEHVLRHLPDARGIDLRNPANVRSLLRRVGVEVPDTRAWRLERIRHEHPVIEALLEWRRAERIATTFGYRWLDEHVGADGRLRGTWSGSDGAAGRMTATAGLHNLPSELRPAVVAEAGHVFVRADLGQIEPRILAAVSGDDALAAATADDDMYAPVAARLGVTRDVAKVAVLGAMYGQTTGHGAVALRGLETAYPTAMAYLSTAARRAEGGHDLRTRGGRLVRMSSGHADLVDGEVGPDGDDGRRAQAARGRYGRNAMVQGAAAEFFKTWAVIVRARLSGSSARIVLCLHDELLVHSPVDAAGSVTAALDDGLQEAAHRWLEPASSHRVHFVTATGVVHRWSDAK